MKSKDLRLLLSMGSSRRLFLGALLGALVNTALVITNAFLIAHLIIALIDSSADISTRIFQLALLWFFRAIYISTFDRWASFEASQLKNSLRSSIVDSPEILAHTPSTHLATLLVKGGNALDIYLARFLPQLFGAVITPIAVIATLFIQDWLSGLIALLTVPLIPIFGALIGKYTQVAVSKKWQSLGVLGKYFEDSLRGIHTLALFARVKSQSQRIEEMGDRYTNETMKVLRVSFLSALVLELAATISVALIAVSIGLRLVNGSIEFLPSLAILVLAPEVYFPLRNAASLFHASADGTTALAELNDIQSINPSTSRVGGAAIDAITSIQWDLWQSPFGTGVLTAAVRGSGEITIVRGGSGLGKTTFLNTFLGYGDSSHVRINEKPIADYDSKMLRSTIGWVPQNPVLIAGTVRELFHFFDKSVSDDEIVQALKRVGLEVDQLSDGLQTKIGGSGERVAALSGGQIRRIAIARALFIEPTLLIADEPTADLDPQSAQEVLQILSDIAATGTIVLVVLHAPDHVIPSAIEMEMVQR